MTVLPLIENVDLASAEVQTTDGKVSNKTSMHLVLQGKYGKVVSVHMLMTLGQSRSQFIVPITRELYILLLKSSLDR